VKKHRIVPEPPGSSRRSAASGDRPSGGGTSASAQGLAAGDAPEAPHPLVGATFVTGAASPSSLPTLGPPEIAFAGRSNSGKSSAINALANRTRLAFASRTPGRTQQINFFALRGSPALVADLPGYGYAAVARSIKRSWQDFLWLYVTTRATLVALVLVVDARHGLKPLDLELLAAFLPSGRPVLVLATKADKLSRSDARDAVGGIARQLAGAFPDHAALTRVVAFSATARTGVADAESAIAAWLG
jgi:GTP-binding protein